MNLLNIWYILVREEMEERTRERPAVLESLSGFSQHGYTEVVTTGRGHVTGTKSSPYLVWRFQEPRLQICQTQIRSVRTSIVPDSGSSCRVGYIHGWKPIARCDILCCRSKYVPKLELKTGDRVLYRYGQFGCGGLWRNAE
jgi:hypothetical protein